MKATHWTLDGLVEHFEFVHTKMPDHKFVWVLGAGASYSSGIPMGGELVDVWINDLFLRLNDKDISIDTWATAENLGLDDFIYLDRASYYSQIYQRRFRDFPEEGFAFLENKMSEIDPGPGYSILAAALAASPVRHNAVITTNFDNLVADALSLYTNTFPFICGHEALTGFVNVAMRRPLICKIHRDLLLAPQNDPRSLRRLHDAWGSVLRVLFEHYTPIFIGYGGNDDTLMDLLESLQPREIRGRILWCYHQDSEPSSRIQKLVAEHNGIMVPVPDFDLLMILLGEKMGIGLLDEELEKRASKRANRYRQRIESLELDDYPNVYEALGATITRSGGWWAWEQKALRQADFNQQKKIYEIGIKHCPDSAELLACFACFTRDVLTDIDEANRLFEQASKIDERYIQNTQNKGYFALCEKKFEVAMQLLDRAASFNNNRVNDLALGINFNRAVCALLNSQNTKPYLEAVALLLARGVKCDGWQFGRSMSLVDKMAPFDDSEFFHMLANVLAGDDDPDKSIQEIIDRTNMDPIQKENVTIVKEPDSNGSDDETK